MVAGRAVALKSAHGAPGLRVVRPPLLQVQQSTAGAGRSRHPLEGITMERAGSAAATRDEARDREQRHGAGGRHHIAADDDVVDAVRTSRCTSDR